MEPTLQVGKAAVLRLQQGGSVGQHMHCSRQKPVQQAQRAGVESDDVRQTYTTVTQAADQHLSLIHI